MRLNGSSKKYMVNLLESGFTYSLRVLCTGGISSTTAPHYQNSIRFMHTHILLAQTRIPEYPVKPVLRRLSRISVFCQRVPAQRIFPSARHVWLQLLPKPCSSVAFPFRPNLQWERHLRSLMNIFIAHIDQRIEVRSVNSGYCTAPPRRAWFATALPPYHNALF